MKTVIFFLLSLASILSADTKPNIIYILADDLGYAELGSYGQKSIKTPNLDRLAADGMRFTNHYSGSAVCAPSRCVLLTGIHTGKSFIRNNSEFGGWHKDDAEGQLPIPDETLTIAEVLKTAGYQTAAIGKWGLGGPSSMGHPNLQGFDFFYGHLCQRKAHNFYQTHLWRDKRKEYLNNEYFNSHQKFPADLDVNDPANYKQYQGQDYVQDLMTLECLKFIKKNKAKPFFLYFASPVPHVSLQVPDDSLQEYLGKFDDKPYLGEKGYLPHIAPRAAYAAMITRLDKQIGEILDLLKELKLEENTLVVFSSDNGPTFNGGSDSTFFQSAAHFSGLKCSLKEGGIRVPMIVRWPGKIAQGKVSQHISSFDDVFPTVCDLIGVKTPEHITGLSFLPELLDKKQETKEALYWEYGNQQAFQQDGWKIYRSYNAKKKSTQTFLYNLLEDESELRDLSQTHPEKTAELIKAAQDSRTFSKYFPSAWDK